MKLPKEILELINSLENRYLVETLTAVCFLQAIALTLFTPSASKSCTEV